MASKMEQARKAVRELLERAGIQRVVVVDDIYEVSVGDLRAASQLDAGIAGQLGVDPSADEAVLEEEVAAAWGDMAPAERRALSLRVKTCLDPGKKDDTGAAGRLAHLLPDVVDCIELAPDTWNERKQALWHESADLPTMFLIDKSLHSSEDEQGIQELSTTLQECGHTSVCGLITRYVDPDHEVSKWSEWTEQYSLPPDRFLVVSKQHLMDDGDLRGFARMLKLMMLNTPCRDLLSEVRNKLDDAVKAATAEVGGKLDIFDLEHIVFRSCLRAGDYEPDTVIRLLGVATTRELQRTCRRDDALQGLVGQVRRLSDIDAGPLEAPSARVLRFRHDELYASGDEVNELHLPIALGDVFERTSPDGSSGSRYVLIAQPCDLVVRHDGNRGAVREAFLCEIQGSPAADPALHYRLEYFGSEPPHDPSYVWLGRRRVVLLDVLDLCSFNPGGDAVMPLEMEPPPVLCAAMSNRFTKVAKFAGEYAELLNAAEGKHALANFVARGTAVWFSKVHKSSGRLLDAQVEAREGEQVLAFNCRRIGRIRQPLAGAILVRFCQCSSREAFPHDYARIEGEPG